MVGTGAACGTLWAALLGLLAVLSAGVGLGMAGWLVALGCAAVVSALVARAVAGGRGLGPADLVTFSRAMLACVVAGLVTESSVGPAGPVTPVLVALAAPALLLDAVDGRVARRTRTASAFGARFDGEADAFLILVLSVHVADSHGAWVLAIGAARYAFWLAGLVWRWLWAPLPPRPWRKVVAAVQGVVLVVAAAGFLPDLPMRVALGIALVLLAESFGRDVWWLASRRPRRGRRTSSASSRVRVRLP